MKEKKLTNRILSLVLIACMLLAYALPTNAVSASSVKFTQVDNSAVVNPLDGRVSADTEEEMSTYKDSDMVRVSIVLEGKSTIEAGYSTQNIASNKAAMRYRDRLESTQASVTGRISRKLGEKLDVVWNLTLAANVISANVEYGQIETIEKLPGVESVVIETRYEPDVVQQTGAADPNMATSGKQIGSAAAWAAGYTGAGSRIAIIDTGIDTDHQSFSAQAYQFSLADKCGDMDSEDYIAGLDLLDAEEIASVADELHAAVEGADAYINAKIPFGYNYVDGNLNITHDYDDQGSHGSHVAGIAAANAYIPAGDGFEAALSSVFVQGVAPDAQLLGMKVFGAKGGAYDSDYMAAIEDAIILNCDAVNLSLGSGNPGRSRNATAEYQAIMDSLLNSGVVVAMSAGNSGSWVENAANAGYLYAEDVSMQTNGSPGSFTNSLAVGSVENDGITGLFFQAGDALAVYNETNYSNEPLATLAGEHEYVMIDGYGTAEDWAGIDLTGKIALCSRGVTSFFEKAEAAVEAGATAVIVCNNQPGIINMDLSDYRYTAPVVSIQQADAAAIRAASTPVTDDEGNALYYTGRMRISATATAAQFNSEYYTMSSFSSWGVPGSLELKPEVVAPGGNINSVDGVTRSGDAYEVMSGTSMASPQVAGMAAVVAQYIRETGLEAKTGKDARTLAQSLLMSTAVPIIDGSSEYQNYYPVLQQGAGLANVGAAVSADSYIMMGQDATNSAADGKVKAELGDDPDRTGTYTFSFTINNLTAAEKIYELRADFFIQAPFLYYANGSMSLDELAYYMDTWTTAIDAAATFTVNGAVLDATDSLNGLDFNGDGTVNSADGQTLLDYITGLVTELSNADRADLDGDGEITTADAYQFFKRLRSKAVVPANGSLTVNVQVSLSDEWKETIDYYYANGTYIQGYVFAEGVSTDEGVEGTAHSIPVFGFYGNWSDASMFEVGTYQTYATGDEFKLPYLGSEQANTYEVTYANEPGVSYFFGGNPLIPDAAYMPERNAINSENGDMISRVSFAVIRNAAASRFTVANQTTGETLAEALPGMMDSAYYYTNGESWRNTGYKLNIGFAPAGAAEGDVLVAGLTLAPEYYVDAAGDVAWDALGEGATFSVPMVIDNTAPTLEDVSVSLTDNTLKVTAYDNQYIAAAALYNTAGTMLFASAGAKQDIAPEQSAEYVLDLSRAKGNKFLLQVMDYAMNTVTFEVELQRALPDMIAFDLEHNYWTSFTADTTADQLEAYSVTNQTYVAGTVVDHYVFASTDKGELHVMSENDLSDVTVVGNMGAVITDMAYNQADGRIYGVVGGYLVTIDKLTGELGIVGEIGVLTNTLACDAAGTFYCNGYGTNAVYSFTLDTIAEPELLCSVHDEVASQYVQTMEINPNNGKLCWISYYVTDNSFAYLYEIDTATGEYIRHNDLRYEMAALLIPGRNSAGSWADPTDTISGVQIAPESLDLLVGATASLSAVVQPWTATDRTVTWTSADDSVATVNDKGVVTGAGAGTTTITAASNLDSGVFATCTVTVSALDVTIQGTLQDENGNPMFYKWNMAEDSTWTGGTAIDTSMTSATVDTLNNKVYIMDAVSDTWGMHLVDPATGESVQSGSNGTGVPLWDMEYSTVFSTADAPKLHGIYYCYYLPAKDPMALDASAFDLSAYLSTYTGASYLVAIASAGYEQIEGENTDHVLMLDDTGTVWHFWTYAVAGSYSAWIDYTPTNLADLGVKFLGDSDGENMYTSMVVGDDGRLYLSAYTGDTNELYRMTYDADSNSYVADKIGDVGDGVWPATITGVTTNETADADPAAGPRPTMQMEAVTVPAEELTVVRASGAETMSKTFAAAAEAKTVEEAETEKTAAPGLAKLSAFAPGTQIVPLSNAGITDEGRTVTITLTAKDADGSDVATNNGKMTVTYDAEEMTLTGVAFNEKCDYTSVNDTTAGTVSLAHVAMDAVLAGETVATLTFTRNDGAVVEGPVTVDHETGAREDLRLPGEPATDPSEPATDPSEPATDPSEPATDPSEPATDPSEPAADPSEPATEPVKPADPNGPADTGDRFATGLWSAVMAACTVSMAVLVFNRKKWF